VADGLCVDGLEPGVHGDEHGVEGDVLDESGDAAAVMEDLGDGFRFEEVLSLGASGFEVLFDEGTDVVLGQGSEAELDADALPEGVMGGLGESFSLPVFSNPAQPEPRS
jgi:hypothetical protein